MSQSGIYNELKPAWWYTREGKLPDAPKQVQLILSDLCNQDCHFCAYRMSGYTSNELFVGDSKAAKYGHSNPVRWIETERALKLVDEIADAGCLAIQFTGGGEPTVHPDHEAIFRKALDRGLRCSLVSNGVKWSDDLINNILPNFDWVRVSIDADTPEAYARIRRTPEENFLKAWTHVAHLVSAAHVYPTSRRTQIGAGYVITPDSWPGIVRFTESAKHHGVHNVRFTAMFSPDDEKPFADLYENITAEIAKARTFETPTFRVYDNFGSRFEDLKEHAPDYSFCSYQYYTAYIGGDLNAYRCCVLAYNKRGLVEGGNLKERSFTEFWNSAERKADLNNLDARGCDRCQFNSKNRAVNYLMANKPDHIEFP